MSMLTGRQLVDELARLGLGTWTADAVRQWIREEPPCPIAEAADHGKPHRYRLLDVLTWLQARAERERARGFTSTAAVQLADRVALVLRQFVTGAPPVAAPDAEPALPPAPTFQRDLLAPASTGNFSAEEIEQSTNAELLMQVIKGRDPVAWQRVENALAARRRRLEDDGLLIPVEDLQQTLDVQALGTRNACQAIVIQLAQRIPDSSTFAIRQAIIQTAIDRMLEGLSRGEGSEEPG